MKATIQRISIKMSKNHVPLRAKYNLETLLGRDFHGVEIASWKKQGK